MVKTSNRHLIALASATLITLLSVLLIVASVTESVDQVLSAVYTVTIGAIFALGKVLK